MNKTSEVMVRVVTMDDGCFCSKECSYFDDAIVEIVDGDKQAVRCSLFSTWNVSEDGERYKRDDQCIAQNWPPKKVYKTKIMDVSDTLTTIVRHLEGCDLDEFCKIVSHISGADVELDPEDGDFNTLLMTTTDNYMGMFDKIAKEER